MIRAREKLPLKWAQTSYNLGLTYSALGVLSKHAKSLEAALELFTASLEVRTRAAMPLAWAETQEAIAMVQTALGIFGKPVPVLPASDGGPVLGQEAEDGLQSDLRKLSDQPLHAWQHRIVLLQPQR